MLCVRCMRSMLSAPTRTSSISTIGRAAQSSPFASPFKRTFSLLSQAPTRPTLPKYTPKPNVGTVGSTQPILSETPSSAFLPTPPPQSIQSRGPKRDTFNPSHLVRKRRHGFLSRLRTRTGRKTLIRRRLKGRRFLSH